MVCIHIWPSRAFHLAIELLNNLPGTSDQWAVVDSLERLLSSPRGKSHDGGCKVGEKGTSAPTDFGSLNVNLSDSEMP